MAYYLEQNGRFSVIACRVGEKCNNATGRNSNHLSSTLGMRSSDSLTRHSIFGEGMFEERRWTLKSQIISEMLVFNSGICHIRRRTAETIQKHDMHCLKLFCLHCIMFIFLFCRSACVSNQFLCNGRVQTIVFCVNECCS